jgi:hypothetical protein
MTKFFPFFRILIVVCFTFALASLAQAQATRTWVSGVGDDVNPCSRTAPCKTFAGAISKTAIGGEIDALDPGGFGAVTITKSMTIDGTNASGFGSILSSAVSGVIVNLQTSLATDPERRVTLRRLSINGTGSSGGAGVRTGLKGISILQGNLTNALTVHVENCYIQNFTQEGINASVNSSSFLFVKDTNIQNCTVGVNVTSASGFFVGTLDRIRVERMTSNGIVYGTNSFGTVRQSLVFSNGADGVSMAASNTNGRVNVDDTVVNNNVSAGVRSGGAGSKLIISNTSIMANTTGAATGGGALESHGNNQISNNGAPGSAFTPLGQQ